ncbi:MAG TPA: dTDP-4-dehydrorhamnose reductase [Candidatus Sericytochromatia bacterium]|jgi:dTDP-4-dehydrorhamnose reductase
MTRILLTGADGQLGQELQRTLVPLGEIIGVGRQALDLTQPDRIRQIISEIKPDLIVNAAAYTAVDKAQTEPELAKSINAVAPTIMAEEQARHGGILIHVSTDYVFDGRKNSPYTEEDAPNPLSVYGQSKLAGEEGIQKTSQSLQSAHQELRYIILRTAWVYGTYGKSNFVKTMLRLGAERDEIRVVADQVGTPTWACDIASSIAILGQKVHEQGAPSPLTGIYNFTSSGVASWYDFAIAIFEEAKQLGFELKVQRVVPITTSEYPTPATRPAYSVLAGQKITAALGSHPPHWRQGLRQMLAELYSRQT